MHPFSSSSYSNTFESTHQDNWQDSKTWKLIGQIRETYKLCTVGVPPGTVGKHYVILPGKPSKSVPTYLKFSHFKHHIRLSFEQVAPFRLTIPLNLIQVEQKHFGKQWLYCLLYTLKFIVKLNLGNEEFIKITICLWFINGWSTDFKNKGCLCHWVQMRVLRIIFG